MSISKRDKPTKEIWKEIPGFPGYEVSNQGQVRSYFYSTGKGWKIAESPQRILRPSSFKGYRGINLSKDGQIYRHRIGRLVLLAFIGPPPNGMEMCHNDSNPTNDHLTNLRWDTHFENMQDCVNEGNKLKLNQEEVRSIRMQYASGKYSQMKLAREFKVSIFTIRYVLTGRGAYKGGLGPIQSTMRRRLTDQQAIAIHRERASGKSLISLAEKYGVSESMVSLIASGKRYSKATGPRVQPYEIIATP